MPSPISVIAVSSPISVIAMSGLFLAKYQIERERRKYVDMKLEEEREHERREDSRKGLKGGMPVEDVIHGHCLHPQHPLPFQRSQVYDTFICSACNEKGTGYRYHCSLCEFNMHWACAVSDRIFSDLEEPLDNLHTFAHKEHPLRFVYGKETHACENCHSKTNSIRRYQCPTCKDQFHLICAKHPTRLFSFLHPEHELELKTRRHLAKCAVCHERGDTNARVYRCKPCGFYLHPGCAQDNIQYYAGGHPLHNVDKSHVLILRQLPDGQTTVCDACGKTCRYWHYTCSSSSSCANVSFHKECVQNYWKAKEPMFSAEMKKEIAVEIIMEAVHVAVHHAG